VYGSGQTSYYFSQTLEGGSKIANLTLISSPVMEDATLDMTIFLAGSIFLDGSLHKVIDASMFNENDECVVQLVKSGESQRTAACHHIDLYQGTKRLCEVY
jgi:hypothetical protein